MKFYIAAPNFDANSGGAVVLHQLCHLINKLGHDASLYPMFSDAKPEAGASIFSSIKSRAKTKVRRLRGKLFRPVVKTHPDLFTPVRRLPFFNRSFCVIYPEIVDGNPLNSRYVVRWLLHQPGHFTERVEYQPEEIYFRFNKAIHPFSVKGSKTSEKFLKVIKYPVEIYNLEGAYSDERRTGSAYCLRKGRGKTIVHDLDESVLIDGLSHSEIASIFKKVKYFFSYDPLTAYSLFAVLCGCCSIVIPDEDVPEEIWYPDKRDRYGIAYGVENIQWALDTAKLQRKRVQDEHLANLDRVDAALGEISEYFQFNLKVRSKSGN